MSVDRSGAGTPDTARALRLLHALSIGLAVGLGAHLGRKLAALFGFCLLFATPLHAQLWYGDTMFVREHRQSRGTFYVDTITYIGHKKVDPRKDWVYQIRPSIFYFDWWREVTYCQDHLEKSSYANFKKFRWFVVNAESFGTDSPLKIGYGGYFLQDSVAFYIAAPNLSNKGVVMHEMSHGLQWIVHDPIGHYPRYFGSFGCGFSYPSDST